MECELDKIANAFASRLMSLGRLQAAGPGRSQSLTATLPCGFTIPMQAAGCIRSITSLTSMQNRELPTRSSATLRHMPRIPALLLALLASICASGIAQTSEPRFRVGLSITSDDDSLKTLVESYLGRELRSLRDVEPVNGYTSTLGLLKDVSKQPIHYALKVIVQKTGQGYVLSVAFLRRYNNIPAQKFVESLGTERN